MSLKTECPLHGFKLINALLGIALPDLTLVLVFVASHSHALSVEHAIGGLLGLISGIGSSEVRALRYLGTRSFFSL